MRVLFVVSLLCLYTALITPAHSEPSAADETLAQGADFVWVSRAQSTSALLHSRQIDGKWSPDETLISRSSKLITTPSIARTRAGDLWVFWSELHGNESKLYYRKQIHGKWSEPEFIETGMEFNGGSAVVLDENDAPWVFWVGNDGQDDDVYCTTRENGKWRKPERINNDNDTPDILPFAGRDENGTIWVVWSGYNGSGYQYYFAQLEGGHWSDQVTFSLDNPLFETIRERFSEQKSLPAGVGSKTTGYIDIQDGKNGLRSFRMLPGQQITQP